MLTIAGTAALLRSFDNVLILTHIRPDGDTVGCAAALCVALRQLGKTALLNRELIAEERDTVTLEDPVFQMWCKLGMAF